MAQGHRLSGFATILDPRKCLEAVRELVLVVGFMTL
jgi:hypothetical protein